MDIKRKNLGEMILLIIYFLYVLIAYWIWFGRGIQETVMILLSVIILLKSRRNRYISAKRMVDILLWMVLFIICFWGIIQAKSHEYLVEDLKSMVGTVLVSIAVIAAITRLEKSNTDVLDFLFVFLNGYFVVNNFIIIIQYFVPYFLMNKTAIASVNNTAYFDQLTGFLGINVTTRWDIWSVTLIILNFHTGYKRNDKRIIIYNVFLFLTSVLICMLNSARAFLIISPFTILIYLFLVRKIKVSRRMRQIFGVFGIILVGVVIYCINPYVNNFINNLISDKFAIYLSGDIDYMVAANDDRVVATYYAVQNSGTFGVGIGTVPMHSTNDQVKYLGLNSASAYIYMIGIVGYFLWTLCLARSGINSEKENLKRILLYFVFLLLLSYFLPVYSSIALLPPIMIIFYIFGIESAKND